MKARSKRRCRVKYQPSLIVKESSEHSIPSKDPRAAGQLEECRRACVALRADREMGEEAPSNVRKESDLETPKKKKEDSDSVVIGSQRASLSLDLPKSPKSPQTVKDRHQGTKHLRPSKSPYEVKRSPFSEIIDGSISEYLGNKSSLSTYNKGSMSFLLAPRRKRDGRAIEQDETAT